MKKKIVASIMLVVLLFSLDYTVIAKDSSEIVENVVANYNHTYALMKNGDVLSWGANYKGSVGVGVESNDIVMPVKILEDVKVVYQNGLAIKKNGELWGWGEIVGSSSPKRIAKNVKTAVCQKYSAFALFIKENNSLWGWGNNRNGQLGTGSTKKKINKPVKIAKNIKKVYIGTKGEKKSYILVINKKNELLGWGDNSFGQIATGDTNYIKTPTKILGNVSQVVTSEGTVAVIRKDKRLYMWGVNTYGQVGVASDKQFMTSPKKVLGNIKSMVIGKGYAAAIDKRKRLYYWGATKYFYDSLSEYLNVEKSINKPKKIAEKVLSVKTEGGLTLFRKVNNELWGMGTNRYGQVGTGSLGYCVSSPVKIIEKVKNYNTNGNAVAAITNKDELYFWGVSYFKVTDNNGVLTISAEKINVTPKYIASDVVRTFLPYTYNMYLKKDGSLWGWGNNIDGQLGIGNKKDKEKPVQII